MILNPLSPTASFFPRPARPGRLPRTGLRLFAGILLAASLAACDNHQQAAVSPAGGNGNTASAPSASASATSPAGAGISAAAPAAARAAGDHTLRLGYIGPSQSIGGPVGWALEEGLLASALKPLGFTQITEHIFPNGPDLNEALLSGKLDIGIYGDTPALFARSSGGATRLLGFNGIASDAWLVVPANGVETPADLAGKRVGLPRGSYLHRYFAGLKDQGVIKDVEEVHLFPRDAQPALERGDIAAYTAPTGLGPQLKAQGLKVIDQASQHGLEGNSVIVASESFLQAHPGFASAFDQAREQGARDLHANPDAYYTYYLTTTAFSEPVVRESWPVSSFNIEAYPQQGLDLLEGTKAFLLSNGLAKQDFSIAEWQWQEPAQAAETAQTAGTK
ncbi:ABC transporter substrate-binding protein [Kerstersia sp.]|uniref:ABC transporter substrate-binding protein n=1 Tax=Kerstersia sp. TaxID=1930783 RepID=UPI003F9370BE